MIAGFSQKPSALAGLLIVGLCGVIVTIGLAVLSGNNPLKDVFSETFLDLVAWALLLVYVTLCGLFSAWFFQNSFVSLIAIVPLAAVPFGLILLGYYIRRVNNGRFVPVVSSTVGISVTLVSIAKPEVPRCGKSTTTASAPN